MIQCANCENPATVADDEGLPLCVSCLSAREAECRSADASYDEGYEAGFADAINDAASELLMAARDVLTSRDKASFARLRAAVQGCKRRGEIAA